MKWFFSILYFSAGGFHRCHFIMKNEAFFLEPKVISWEENSSRIIIHRKPHTVFPQPLTNVLLVTAWFTAAQGPPDAGRPTHLASHVTRCTQCRAIAQNPSVVLNSPQELFPKCSPDAS